MQQQTNSRSIAKSVIYRMIEALHHLLLFIKTRNEKVIGLLEQRKTLDTNNPDYAAIREDKRENLKMFLQQLIMFLSFGIDALLGFMPLDIACSKYGWPGFLKIVVPIALIVLEIGISYFQIQQQRTGEKAPWLLRNAQYLVMVILTALSVLTIVFTIDTYNPAVDGENFIGFVLGTILFQLALLTASVMLHLWLIRHSESLVETFSYFEYKRIHNNLSAKIEKIERGNKKKYIPNFIKDCQRLVLKMKQFKQSHPDDDAKFEEAMPADLVDAINKAMGKRSIVDVDAKIPHETQ